MPNNKRSEDFHHNMSMLTMVAVVAIVAIIVMGAVVKLNFVTTGTSKAAGPTQTSNMAGKAQSVIAQSGGGLTTTCVNPEVEPQYFVNGISQNINLCYGKYTIDGWDIIADNVILDCGYAILRGNNTNVTALRLHANGITVKNCVIADVDIGIFSGDHDNQFVFNNIITNSQEAIKFLGVSNSRIERNTITDASVNGINVYGNAVGFSNPANGNTILLNELVNARILVTNLADGNIVQENNVYFPAWLPPPFHGQLAGIHIGGYVDPTTNTQVQYNTVRNVQVGIKDQGTSTVAFQNNIGDTETGIVANGISGTYTNNIIEGSTVTGIYVRTQSGSGFTLQNNAMCNNVWDVECSAGTINQQTGNKAVDVNQGACTPQIVYDQCQESCQSTLPLNVIGSYKLCNPGGNYVYTLPQGATLGRDGITLDCDGATLQGPGSGTGLTIPALRKGITIKNCTLKGWSNGIDLQGSSSVVKGSTFTNVNTGILVAGMMNQFEENKFLNIPIGMKLSGNDAKKNTVVYNTFFGITQYGIWVDATPVDGTQFRTKANWMIGTGSPSIGIYVTRQVPGLNDISGNIIQGFLHGISLSQNYNNELRNNELQSNTYGLYIQNSGGLELRENEMCSNGVTDVYCTSSNFITLNYDRCQTWTSVGLCVDDASPPLPIGACPNLCPTQSHNVCQGGSCVQANGAGVDQCWDNYQCAVPQTHKICSSGSCISVNGVGADQCQSNSQCGGQSPLFVKTVYKGTIAQ
jgi:parallel beta-helix repeat protein